MSKKKTTYSVARAEKIHANGRKEVYYLSQRDEDNGVDIRLDLLGFTITAF